MTVLADVLVRIVERRRERLGAETPPRPVTSSTIERQANALLAGVDSARGRAIIAEVKMGSPRIGSLTDRVDPEAQALAYRKGGATALSVVVEPDFFYGSYELLRRCKEASGLPALAKDFVVSERQLDWAAEAGAEAILLIAALYSPEELGAWAAAARARALVPLIETHAAEDVVKLGGQSWELVGINNRDLRTFEVDLGHSIELRPSLPAAALTVAESGIRSAHDLGRLAGAGFDAFLIGEALLTTDDPGALLSELLA